MRKNSSNSSRCKSCLSSRVAAVVILIDAQARVVPSTPTPSRHNGLLVFLAQ